MKIYFFSKTTTIFFSIWVLSSNICLQIYPISHVVYQLLMYSFITLILIGWFCCSINLTFAFVQILPKLIFVISYLKLIGSMSRDCHLGVFQASNLCLVFLLLESRRWTLYVLPSVSQQCPDAYFYYHVEELSPHSNTPHFIFLKTEVHFAFLLFKSLYMAHRLTLRPMKVKIWQYPFLSPLLLFLKIFYSNR